MPLDAARAEIGALDEYGRIAARHLFSTLAALESIAVEVARRGAIAGHLDDELRHRDSFLTLADAAGGRVPVSPEIADLVSHMTALDGAVGDALLAVVGEAWVEAVFERLAQPGIFSGLFRAFMADEERHASAALDLPIPPQDAAGPALIETERLLYRSAMSASYLAPIGYLRGPSAVWDAGLAAVEAHRRACRHLGFAPAADIRRLGHLCAVMRARAGQAVEIAPPSLWRVSASRLWNGPAPITAHVTVPVPRGHALIEAAICRRLARALARHERLRVVYRAGRWYRLPVARIGVRRETAEGIVTVILSGAEKLDLRATARLIARHARALARQPYETVPPLHGLDAILPPATIAATISYCGHYGPISYGLPALVEAEGCPLALGIGAPTGTHFDPSDRNGTRGGGKVTIGVVADHRVMDARELGLVCAALADDR